MFQQSTHNGLNSFKSGYSIVLKRSGTAVGEYVQISGIATAGTACSPNGLPVLPVKPRPSGRGVSQGRDTTGALLSCVNGKWHKGSNSAGMYALSGTTCISPNTVTGGCSCGSGTSALKMVEVKGVAGTSYVDPESQRNYESCMHASGGHTCPPPTTITVPGSPGFTIFACM